MNAFFSELVTYIIKFIILFSVSVGGIFAGKHIVLNKKKKEQHD